MLSDPHFKARGAIVRLPDNELGSVPAPCTVPRFSGFANVVPRTGPAMGEHNRAVFSELGLDEAELDMLKTCGVI